jgi:hypothetical protein
MSTSQHSMDSVITEDFLSSTQFCQKYKFAHSTLSKHIHKGEIALHQFSDAARPKINVAEALQVMSAIRRPYTSAFLRLVRYDENGNPVPQIEKPDLFA